MGKYIIIALWILWTYFVLRDLNSKRGDYTEYKFITICWIAMHLAALICWAIINFQS